MTFKRIIAFLMAVITCAAMLAIPSFAANAEKEITVLFTHDLHSHLLPAANENGKGEYGGYARLMSDRSGKSNCSRRTSFGRGGFFNGIFVPNGVSYLRHRASHDGRDGL